MIAILLILGALGLMLVLTYAAYRFGRKQNAHGNESVIPYIESATASPLSDNCDVALIDESGEIVARGNEISSIPSYAYKLDSSDDAISRVKHLASDLFKGTISIPNKTVEIAFKADIQKGLAEGTYKLMKTKSGETLADAVNSSNKIVGKGRVIQGGKVRQLASGAFQLVSIAVAQSHLADIERSLGSIRSAIGEILSRQENQDKSEISGAIEYLTEIFEYMKGMRGPDEISQQKANQIEGIIRDHSSWKYKLHSDVESIIDSIRSLDDGEIFGTGDTFESLKVIMERMRPLLQRHALILHLSGVINFVTAYLDPSQVKFSRIKTGEKQMSELINAFQVIAMAQIDKNFSRAFFNGNDILFLRRAYLQNFAKEQYALAQCQLSEYEELMQSLEKNIRNLIGGGGLARIAVSFDGHGQVKDAAFLR